ncbi:MAG: hypothetical protein JNL60_15730 [Bacteroidia bacterium]|nr:hypothetical protein [Bacteroidia bacterium]
MIKSFIHFLLILFVFICHASVLACQCPLTRLSIEECDKYEIIFKGKIISVNDCGDKFGEAVFEIDELYKGNATKEFKILFECGLECSQKFIPGQEWIIYSRYKQIDNAKMDWCSRSRKYFKVDKEDFYAVTYGNDYYDEVKFLREKLGVHRFLADKNPQDGNRNQIPDKQGFVIVLICSLAGLVLFYYLFNRFFR